MAEGVVVQLASGEIVSCNRAAEEILGLTRDQMAGRTSVDPRWRSIHEDGSPFPGDTHPAMVSLATGRPLRDVVMGVHRPDGRLTWLSITSVPIPGPDGRPASVVTTFVDITERRRAEEKLARNEANLRSFVDAIDDCMFVLDRQGTILHVNRGTTARLGYDAAELVGRNVLEVHPEGRREEAARIVADVVAGLTRLCPVPLLRKDGRQIPVETRVFSGHWNGQEALFGLSKDLSELRASEEKFHKTFRENPSPMVLRALSTGRVVDVNRAFTETLGYSREQIVGQVAVGMRAIADPDRQIVAEKLLKAHGAFRDFEMDTVTADGRTLHGFFSGEVIELQDERLLLTVMKDVTALRKAEGELREALAYNRSLFEASLDGLVVLDGEGRIRDANASMVAATGFPRAELLGSDFSGWFTDPAAARAVAAEAIAKGLVRGHELRLRRRDGAALPVEYTAAVYRNPDGSVAGVFAAARDVSARKQAEEALRTHRELLRQILDLVPQSIFWKDRDSVYLGCNRSFARAAGLECPDEIVGKSDLELPWKREEAEAYRADDALVVRTGRPKRHIVERQRQADGTDRWVETSKVPMFDAHGETLGVLGVFDDITERRLSEIALLEAKERLGEVLENSLDASYKRELQSNSYAYMSPVFTRITGFTSAELEAFPMEAIVDRIHPDDRGEVERTIATALSSPSGEPFRTRYRFLHRCGEYRWLEDQFVAVHNDRGEPAAVIGSVRDIEEKKEAEDALARAEEQLRTFFDRSPIGKAITGPDGSFLRVNQALCELLGYSADELLTRSFLSLLHPDDAEVVKTVDQSVRDGTADGVDLDLRHLTRDGKAIWTHVRGSTLRDPEGKPIQLMAHILDIRDRKAAELSLRESNEQLEERVAERTTSLVEANRELEGYSHSVAHELRTPLRAIDGYIALISQESGDRLNDDERRLFARVRWNAQRMGQMIDDLLVFSRTGRAELTLRPVDMTQIAREAYSSLASDPVVRARATFSIAPLPVAFGDAALLKRVWENLLSNAVKFSAERPQPEIRIEGRIEGDDAVYRIRDNGVGFDMTYVDKLFGVFQRLHAANEFEGSGVGLALVRRIVLRHGGRVWAEGGVDTGATFSFSLPMPDRPAQSAV